MMTVGLGDSRMTLLKTEDHKLENKKDLAVV